MAGPSKIIGGWYMDRCCRGGHGRCSSLRPLTTAGLIRATVTGRRSARYNRDVTRHVMISKNSGQHRSLTPEAIGDRDLRNALSLGGGFHRPSPALRADDLWQPAPESADNSLPPHPYAPQCI